MTPQDLIQETKESIEFNTKKTRGARYPSAVAFTPTIFAHSLFSVRYPEIAAIRACVQPHATNAHAPAGPIKSNTREIMAAAPTCVPTSLVIKIALSLKPYWSVNAFV